MTQAIERVTWAEFAKRYCEPPQTTIQKEIDVLIARLHRLEASRGPKKQAQAAVKRSELEAKLAELRKELVIVGPDALLDNLQAQQKRYNPTGWFIARCEMFDSHYFGSRVVLPYGGPENTFKEPPAGPFSPRGLASDQSMVECLLLVEDLPPL